jgi:hypothetical protein
MQKRCLSCATSFALSESGKRQKYCPKCSKRGIGQLCGLPASNPLNIKGAEKHFSAPIPPDLGAFVRAQIIAQQDQPNPIHFTTPDGIKGRVWLASDEQGRKKIGDDHHWRMNVPAAAKVDEDARRLRASASMMEIWDTELDRLRGFRVRLCVEGEKELQVLGCGWRIVTVQLRGKNVFLHHNSNKATMKRPAFKALLNANKRLRRKRPTLRLVVSNPKLIESLAA